MENNCISLKTARKLKAAGFPQLEVTSQWIQRIPDVKWYLSTDGTHRTASNWCAAPTAQELADQLPDYVEVGRFGDGWFAAQAETAMSPDTAELGNTMAEALASLYLKLNKAKQ